MYVSQIKFFVGKILMKCLWTSRKIYLFIQRYFSKSFFNIKWIYPTNVLQFDKQTAGFITSLGLDCMVLLKIGISRVYKHMTGFHFIHADCIHFLLLGNIPSRCLLPQLTLLHFSVSLLLTLLGSCFGPSPSSLNFKHLHSHSDEVSSYFIEKTEVIRRELP